jgi:hypothetical protein
VEGFLILKLIRHSPQADKALGNAGAAAAGAVAGAEFVPAGESQGLSVAELAVITV